MTPIVLIVAGLVGTTVTGWFCAFVAGGKVERLEADVAERDEKLLHLADTEAELTKAAQERDHWRDVLREQLQVQDVLRSRQCHPTGDGLGPVEAGTRLAAEVLAAVEAAGPARMAADLADPHGLPRRAS